jgi:D-glycero-alpha-D-manno-heptose-7-phosphate kinase
MKAQKVINAAAPVRICDNGGWTDTWFAQYGAIFNIAVSPYAEVQVEVFPARPDREHIWLDVPDYGDHYAVNLDQDGWDRHPLLEAAIKLLGVPEDVAIRISITSQMPGGASVGTSAAVTVALVGALDCLTPGMMTPHQVAMTAHHVETDMLGRQSGVQDQLASAHGGINYLEMSAYPHARVTPIQIPEGIWRELERRLALVYLGKSHDSSQVHKKVIQKLENAGPDCKQLEDLRLTAEKSKMAVLSGDFSALGTAMIENTEAQARLHPSLVNHEAWQVIEIAQKYGALGWKVNGAGGEGGSLTLLCESSVATKERLLKQIEAENEMFRHIPIRLDRYGLRTWEAS